jgi:hypothetical protein
MWPPLTPNRSVGVCGSDVSLEENSTVTLSIHFFIPAASQQLIDTLSTIRRTVNVQSSGFGVLFIRFVSMQIR